MQPLLRHIVRPSGYSSLGHRISSSVSKQASRRWSQPIGRAVCLQCQFRAQSRLFSDNRSTSTGNSSKTATKPEENADAATKYESDPSPSNESPPKPLFSKKTEELPSQEEKRRWDVSKSFSSLMDNLQSNVFIAGQRLNDLTGYSGIEALKRQIEEQEEQVRTTRTALREAKEAFTSAITKRSASQREVNELLQRKHAWSPQDLERFTTLYRSDHANEQEEIAAQEALAAAERNAEESASKLSRTILARYHEEQIWSDKIRRMSTWGTWGLMGVNVLLFVVFQIAVEPWRRKRLVNGFEEKVKEALERENAASHHQGSPLLSAAGATEESPPKELGSRIEDQSVPIELPVSPGITVETTSPPLEPLPAPPDNGTISPWSSVPASLFSTSYREAILELFSDKQILVRRFDVTTIALQSAGVGAAIAGLLAILLRKN